jgi:hypothetical protein
MMPMMSMTVADRQLQTNNRTFLGRYWTEHSVLRRYVPSDDGLAVLSFGCSTGEELATLGALFPAARLYGCDVDWHNLRAARALLGRAAIVFESTEREVLRHGPFDVIVCNSVLLQPTRLVDGRPRGIDPERWLDAVALLDAALAPGGLLQLINSNIPFRYHPLAAGYDPIRSPLIFGPHFVDQFDLRGRHLCTGVAGAGWSAIVSRHLGEEAWRDLQPSDLHDVHLRKRGGPAPLPVVHDECLPNLPHGRSWASGAATYRPTLTDDTRPSTHLEVDVQWRTVGVDNVRLEREARRIWFDGTVVPAGRAVVEMTGSPATAFIEAMTGRPASRLALDAVLQPQAVRASAF